MDCGKSLFFTFFRSNRLTTPAAISQYLADLPSGSEASGIEEEDEEDIDFIVRRRE
jgi:hypothetical protein